MAVSVPLDVAIGAPQEDDFSGAVYIYHGDAGGVVPQYSMVGGVRVTCKLFMQPFDRHVGNLHPVLRPGVQGTRSCVPVFGR